MADETRIVAIPLYKGTELQDSKSVEITANGTTTVTADSGSVAVKAVSITTNVPTGITPSGEISITENGTYNVTEYASANVNVETGITPSGTIEIVENGEVDVTQYATANVNVPTGGDWSLTEEANDTGTTAVFEFVGAEKEVILTTEDGFRGASTSVSTFQPTSDSDREYYTLNTSLNKTNDGGLYEVGETVTIQAEKLWIWGGGVKINGVVTSIGSTYSSALEYTVQDGDIITLELNDGSGGSND